MKSFRNHWELELERMSKFPLLFKRKKKEKKGKKKSYADQRKREPPIEIHWQSQWYIILLNRYIGLLMWKQKRSKSKKTAKTIKDTWKLYIEQLW